MYANKLFDCLYHNRKQCNTKTQFLFGDGFQFIVESHHVLFWMSFECAAIAFCGVQGFVKMCQFMGNIDKNVLSKICLTTHTSRCYCNSISSIGVCTILINSHHISYFKPNILTKHLNVSIDIIIYILLRK